MRACPIRAEPADFRTPTSSAPSISADGRYLAFDSFASNLTPNAEDGGVFVRDTRAGTTEAVSIRADGTVDDFADSPAISGDGRYVAFVSDNNGLVAGGNGNFYQVFVRDRVARVTTRISSKINGNQGTDDSDAPSLSYDGRYVAFESDSPGLVTADTNESTDVFVRDRYLGSTRRVSVDAAGAQVENGGESPSIDGTGTVVAFTSSDELVPNDTNVWEDVYARNLATNTMQLVSRGSGGAPANGSSRSPVVSANGRYVAFVSSATNLDGLADTNGASDVFIRDLWTGTTVRASRSSTVALAHGDSGAPSISGDGQFVSFESIAPDLVGNDTNGVMDTFVFDRTTGANSRVSTDQLGAQLPEGGSGAVLSSDGRSVTFCSDAQIPGQTPAADGQLYVRLTVPSATPR